MGSGSSGCCHAKVSPGVNRVKLNIADEKIDLLLQSWIDVKEYGAENIAAIAFKGLFRLAPETKSMFIDFAEEHHLDGNKLFMIHCKIVMNFIGASVGLLHDKQSFHASIEFLGLKHGGFNITKEHFQIFGEQFVIAMRQCLKEDFPNPVEEAWRAYYEVLAEMIQGAVKDYERAMSQESVKKYGTNANSPTDEQLVPLASPSQQIES